MNADHLTGEELRIKQRMKREYVATEKSAPIFDGVVNPQHYLSSSPPILWILKEPYCDGNKPEGGDWSLVEALNDNTDSWSRLRAFQPICYINHGIWTGQHDWNKMPWLRDSVEIRMGLKKIAFINISKLPGLKWSPTGRIVEAYQKYREVVLDQIKTYAPKIIFACDPHANLLLREFGLSQWTWFGSAASVHASSGQRLVLVRHPSSRTNRATYVNDAIKAATAELATPAISLENSPEL